MSNRCRGKSYFNKDEILQTKLFVNKDGGLCKQDERTRFAYLVVSKKEARELAGSLEDDAKVLDAIESKYKTILSGAISKEDLVVKEEKKVKNTQSLFGYKLVHFTSADAYNITSEGNLLKIKRFKDAHKEYFKDEEKSSSKINVSYLHLNNKECNELVSKENYELKKQDISQDMREAYALISVPYIYNYEDKDNEREFILTKYDNEISISLMPKICIEYGVFFDGTANNMYNIDFYQDYKKYITGIAVYMNTHAGKIEPNTVDFPDFKKYITHHPDPQRTTQVMNMLRNEIINNIRYFEDASTFTKKDLYTDAQRDRASTHTSKIFDFLVEIRDTLSEKDEGWMERLSDWWKDISDVTGTPIEIKTFVIDKILPDSSDDSSYVNGYTNIKRLYEHYRGDDNLILEKEKKAHERDLKRFKVYTSGSGTIDPVDKKKLDNDSFVGLGLGGGSGGVKAHILYTCHKMIQELREKDITHVDELILDVFGFSRGATEARHFICSIMNEFELLNQDGYEKYALKSDVDGKNILSPLFERDNGVYTTIYNRHYFNPLCTDVEGIEKTVYAGGRTTTVLIKNPYYKKSNITVRNISFRHANIGDTVTHYGIMQSDDSKQLNIDFNKDKIGSVFHLMAMDEFRYNFESHSIFENSYDGIKHSQGKFKEFIIPGAHADVGGGYENSSSDERIQFPRSYSNYKNFMKWNNRYGWIDKTSIKKETDFKKVEYYSDMSENGIYYIENSSSQEVYDSFQEKEKTFYMYREELSWEYELVALKIFHNEATAKDIGVPLVPVLDKYLFKNQSKDEKYLADTYEILKTQSKLKKELHQELRQKYIHHSSNSDSIANPPSSEGNNIVYGQRVVYGSTGNKFPFKDFS